MEPTTFLALKAMEQRGYIRRKKTPNNKKKVFILLTPKGRALKRKLVPLALEVNKVAIHGAGAADVAAARKLLLRMIENLAADEAKALRRSNKIAQKTTNNNC